MDTRKLDNFTILLSGHKLFQVLTLLVIAVTLMNTMTQVSAKRGCASFGHSCFGGHGKRSQSGELVPENAEVQNDNIVFFPRGGQYEADLPMSANAQPGDVDYSIKYLMMQLLKSLEEEKKLKNKYAY